MNVATPMRTDHATVPPPAPRAAQEAPLGPALRAAFFREFRPALPFALIILAFIALMTVLPALVEVLYPDRAGSRLAERLNILANADVETLLVPLGVIVGLLLGVAQAGAGRGQDSWAFLVHRPIRRGVLFLGRVLAALALYGIAAVFPAVVLTIYAAASRQPPYDWHMNLPLLIDLACGTAYLFAGMLMVERKAFIAWRFLPPASLVIMSVVVLFLPGFWISVLIAAGFAAVLGLAAWGSHASNGNQLPAPRLTHAATVATLFLGGTVLLSAKALALKTAVNSMTQGWAEQIEQRTDTVGFSNNVLYRGRVTRYSFLPDGTIARSVITLPRATEPATGKTSEWTYYSADADEPVTLPTQQQMNDLSTHAASVGRDHFRNGYREVVSNGPLQGGLERVRQANGTFSFIFHENWYVVPNAGVLKGYDVATHAYVGSIGVDGFAPPGRVAQPFDCVLGDSFCVGPKGVYSVDLTSHTTQLEMEFPAGFTLVGCGNIDAEWSSSPISGAHAYYSVLRGTDRLLIFDTRYRPYKLQATLMLTQPNASHLQLFAFLGPERNGSGGRWGVKYEEGQREDPWQALGVTFDVYDPAGKLLEDRSFPAEMAWDPPRQPPAELVSLAHGVRLVDGALDGLGNLPAMQAMTGFRNWANPSSYQGQMDPYPQWYAAGAGLVLVCSGVLVFWGARRYRVRFAPLWALAALAFGPVVGLVLIATYTLPRRGRCPSCGARRALAGERCPHCGKDWPAPERNGTEIFG